MPLWAAVLTNISARADGGGFVVYSVGESLAFDGGKPGVRARPSEALFRWPEAPVLPPAEPEPPVLRP